MVTCLDHCVLHDSVNRSGLVNPREEESRGGGGKDRLEGVSENRSGLLRLSSTVRCSVNRFKAVRRRVVLLIGAEHRLPTTFPLRPSPVDAAPRRSLFNFSAIFEEASASFLRPYRYRARSNESWIIFLC